MTPEKVVSVLSQYRRRLATTPMRLSQEQFDSYCHWRHGVPHRDVLCHLAWMCEQAIDFVAEGRMEKAMRWLGFIQGVLWALGIKTLNELRDDSKPDEQEEELNGNQEEER